jgi:transposase
MTLISSLPSPAIFRKGGKDYRRWTDAHKRQIVEETFVPGSSVSIVARRHDVNANQVFKWRMLYHRGELGGSPVKAVDGFLPVGVIGHDGVLPAARIEAEKQGNPQPVITLSLRGGTQVRIAGDVGLPALRCVLKTVLGES